MAHQADVQLRREGGGFDPYGINVCSICIYGLSLDAVVTYLQFLILMILHRLF